MHKRELRSTEAALELLDSFKPLRTRGIIRQQMLSKSLDILQQFGRELDATTNIFNMHKARCASSSCALLLRCQQKLYLKVTHLLSPSQVFLWHA